MAIDLGQKTIEVQQKRRSWRVEMFCEFGQEYTICVWRETVWIERDSGVMLKQERDTAPIIYTLAQLSQSTPAAVNLAAQIAALADNWDQAEGDWIKSEEPQPQ